jgi:hypothetical protein
MAKTVPVEEETTAVGNCDFRDRLQAGYGGFREHCSLHLIVGASWIGLESVVRNESEYSVDLHRFVGRFACSVDAANEFRREQAALGGDRCDVRASVTLAALDSDCGKSSVRELLDCGIRLELLRGSDLEWVDLLKAPLPT